MNEFEKQLASQRFRPVPTEWRAKILNAAETHSKRGVPASGFRTLPWLRELLWPCPRAWGALAGIWIVIAAFQLVTPGAAPASRGEAAMHNVISVAEQRRELAELLDTAPRTPERSPADRPRSARPLPWRFV